MVKYLIIFLLSISCVFVSDEEVCQGSDCRRPDLLKEKSPDIVVFENLAVFDKSGSVPTGSLVTTSDGVIENCVAAPGNILVSPSCQLTGINVVQDIRPVENVSLSFTINGQSFTRAVRFGIYETACFGGSNTASGTMPRKVLQSEGSISVGNYIICNVDQLRQIGTFAGQNFEVHKDIDITGLSYTDFLIPNLADNNIDGRSHTIGGFLGRGTVSNSVGGGAALFQSLSTDNVNQGSVKNLRFKQIDINSTDPGGNAALFAVGYYPTVMENIYVEDVSVNAAIDGVASRFSLNFLNTGTLEDNLTGFLSGVQLYQVSATGLSVVTYSSAYSVYDPAYADQFLIRVDRNTTFDTTPTTNLRIFELE